MGLAITRGLLAAVGGRVWAENCPARARGSRSWCRRGDGRRDGGSDAARILLVDDEPNILATIAPLLRARGYEVLTAMTGRAALEPSIATSPT